MELFEEERHKKQSSQKILEQHGVDGVGMERAEGKY